MSDVLEYIHVVAPEATSHSDQAHSEELPTPSHGPLEPRQVALGSHFGSVAMKHYYLLLASREAKKL